MKYRIIIIGCGQLGSRHLQALAKSKLSFSIDVVDPIQASLDVAAARYAEIQPTITLAAFHKEIPAGADYELAIIATPSLTRAAVTRDILLRSTVRRLFFEKFLFPCLAEYDEIGVLLEEKKIPAWVNCPRRIYPDYQRFKELFHQARLNFFVTGGPWGLACNSVHFLDFAAWLSGEKDFTFDGSSLESKEYESLRPGFIEFGGTLRGRGEQGSEISLTAFPESELGHLIVISSAEAVLVLDEIAGRTELRTWSSGGKIEQMTIRLPYQSELTHLLAEDLILNNSCPLTPFNESANFHKVILQAFLRHQAKSGHQGNICPIT